MSKSATQWLEDVESTNERLAHDARLRLGGLGPADAWMTAQLAAGVDFGDQRRRFWSIVGLSSLARSNALGPEARTICWRLISVATSDPALGNRQAALTALGRFPAHAHLIVPAIARVVQADREAAVRVDGIRALCALGAAAAPAAWLLVAALEDFDASVARHASIALKFVPVEAEHVQVIIAASLAHRDPDVRAQLQAAIRLQGYDASSAA